MKNCGDTYVFKRLDQVSRTPNREVKRRILANLLKTCNEMKFIADFIVKDVNVGVSEVLVKGTKCGAKKEVNFEDFKDLVYQLQQTTSTTKKRTLLDKFFNKTDRFHCEWYKRILLKNLKLGIKLETLESSNQFKTLGNQIKSRVQLGFEYWKLEEKGKVDKIVEKCDYFSIERKIDGIRCLTLVDKKGDIYFFTRNGKEIETLYDSPIYEEIKTCLAPKFLKIFSNGFVLDGELYSKNWNETMSSIFTRKNSQVSKALLNKIVYYLFDVLDLKTFLNKGRTQPYLYRRRILDKSVPRNCKHIQIIPMKIVNSKKENVFEVARKEAENEIKAGYEGVMVKCLGEPYHYGRTTSWIKVKSIKSDDFKIIGVDEKGENADEIKALIIDVNGVENRVSSGLTKELKQCIKKHPKDPIGLYVEVAYQEKTAANKLRFPRILRFRLDKSPREKVEKLQCNYTLTR